MRTVIGSLVVGLLACSSTNTNKPDAGPTCPSGFGICTVSGVEVCTDSQTDPNNCGACGTTCPAGERCGTGHCGAECPADSTACPTVSPTYCAILASDVNNCGACGSKCPIPGEACVGGQCQCGFTS